MDPDTAFAAAELCDLLGRIVRDADPDDLLAIRAEALMAATGVELRHHTLSSSDADTSLVQALQAVRQWSAVRADDNGLAAALVIVRRNARTTTAVLEALVSVARLWDSLDDTTQLRARPLLDTLSLDEALTILERLDRLERG